MEKSQESIFFHFEDTPVLQLNFDHIKKWITTSLIKEGFQLETINCIFCSDNYLLSINQKHLNHDYFTDIITFEYSSNPIFTDLFISVDRVEDNAHQRKIAFGEELRRVIIHGLLHVMGYKDKTEEAKENMRRKEDDFLLLYSTINSSS